MLLQLLCQEAPEVGTRALSLMAALAHSAVHRQALWQHGGLPLLVKQLTQQPPEGLQAAASLLASLSHSKGALRIFKSMGQRSL